MQKSQGAGSMSNPGKILVWLPVFLMAALPVLAAQVTFVHQAPGAGQVNLAGEFNNWSDSANPMQQADGVWSLTLELAPGDYQYKYVVDGSWREDPGNPRVVAGPVGGKNSVLVVN